MRKNWVSNKVDKDFPCKDCTHRADRHFISVADNNEGVCLDCATGQYVEHPNEHWHLFKGDNLKYIELLHKREEIRNE